MKASGLFTRSAVFIYLLAASLWAACFAGGIALHQTTAGAAKVYRLGAFAVRTLQLTLDMQLEQVAALATAPDGGPGPERAALETRFGESGHHILDYRTARGRFNEGQFGPGISDALETADAGVDRLERIRAGLLAGSASTQETIDFYSGLLSSLMVPVIRLGEIDGYSQETAAARAQIAGLAKAANLAAREMALGTALAAGRTLEPRLASEWQASADRRQVMLAELEAAQTPREFIAPARADALLGKVRNGAGQSFDDAFRAELGASVENRLHSLNSLAISRILKLTNDARRVTSKNGFIVTALIVLASLATLAAVRICHAGMTRHAFIVLMLVFNLAMILWGLTTSPQVFSHETNPLETLQALVIAVAFALFCREAMVQSGPVRTAAIVMAALCFMMFFREVDFRLLNAPDWIVNVTNGTVRRVIFLVLALAVAAYALLQTDHLRSLARQAVSPPVWPLFAWVVLLGMGEAVEAIAHITRKDDLPGFWAGGQLFEELLELDAYIAVLYAAFVFRSLFPALEESAAQAS